MKAKKTIAEVLAGIALKSAKTDCGAASCFGSYQPKEPKALKEMMQRK